MMFAVVYLCSKLGQVAGEGLFAVVKRHYPRWFVYGLLATVIVGNIVEAGADIGGMAAALDVLVPIPIAWVVVAVTLTILGLQIWGSYTLIRNIFRWLALALLAYVGSAILAKPEVLPILKATFVPHLRFDRDTLAMLVAIVGTTLSRWLKDCLARDLSSGSSATDLWDLSGRIDEVAAVLAGDQRPILNRSHDSPLKAKTSSGDQQGICESLLDDQFPALHRFAEIMREAAISLRMALNTAKTSTAGEP